MSISTFIANRIAFNQNRSFSRFIIRLSVVATIISVAAMIITLAFANGFQKRVSEKVFSFWGHMRIQESLPYTSLITEEIPIINNAEIVREVKKQPFVKAIYPFATRYAILKTKDDLQGVLVKGLDKDYDSGYLREFIVEGSFIRFNDSTYSRDIMISKKTAEELQLKLNDRVLIYFIRPDGSKRPDRLTIKGIFKTGVADFDNSFAIGDMQLIRQLNDWQNNQIGGYEIVLNDYKKADTAAQILSALPGFDDDWRVQNIRDYIPNIFDWLNMQDTTRNVLIGIMIVVAVINLITCLIILVLERMRMVGVLKAIGASDWVVQKIFIRHSLIIAARGILIGAAVGLILLFIQDKTGFIRLDEEAYFMETAAVQITGWEVAAICVATFGICLLVLLIPSYIVKKIQPVKAIHFR
ncbi:ABC transporter permease [Niabella insulamsoli]|uniref:ABC transporter permease n=1 Tax=Niabella insulamsoli TaxID=3144874 RepID=UPI0031FBC8CC